MKPCPLLVRALPPLVLLLALGAAQAQPATLAVKVVAEDGRGLADVQVAVAGVGTVTDADGRGRIEAVPPGRHTVEVRLLGFEPEEVTRAFAPGEAATLWVELTERPVELGAVDVEAQRLDDWTTMGGFYARRARGAGAFFTGEELRSRATTTLSAALAGVRGVTVAPIGYRRTLVSNRGGTAAGSCPLVVFLDGVATGITDIDDVALDDVAAVEVYRGLAELPLRYHVPYPNIRCGAVLIWTRTE